VIEKIYINFLALIYKSDLVQSLYGRKIITEEDYISDFDQDYEYYNMSINYLKKRLDELKDSKSTNRDYIYL